MQINNISMYISGDEFKEILKTATWPEGMTILDSSLNERIIEFVVKMASYFGIPIRVRMELQSYGGSKIFFKVTPPIKSSMAKNLGLSVADDKINSYASYALTEVDLVELSRGRLKDADISELSISTKGISVVAENVAVDWQDVFSAFMAHSNGSPIG
ncbi:MAG: hypothetical protein ACOX4K_08480 [Bacillota bacterium]|jgi:ribosomal protein L11